MQKSHRTKTITFNRDMLINELVLNMEGIISKADVITMYNQLENNIINHLLQAAPNKNIKLKVFNGIYLLSQFIPDEYRKGSLYLEEHIRFKAKFTTYLKRRLNGKH